MEEYVTSIEISKELNELGVKQDSHFWWDLNGLRNLYELVCINELPPNYNFDSCYSAFTSAELVGILRKFPYPMDLQTRWYENGGVHIEIIFSRSYKGKLSNKRMAIYQKLLRQKIDQTYEDMPKTEADARAEMLIYLIKNKILKL